VLLLKNAQILHHDGSLALGSIVIEKNIIKQVGEYRSDEKFDEIIDCSDKLIMPGLINAHCHAPMSLFRSLGDDLPLNRWLEEKILPAEERLTPESAYWGTQLAIAEMLKCGVTAFGDMYFFLREMAQAVGDSGIRAVLSRGIVAVGADPEGGFCSRLEDARSFFTDFNGAYNGRLSVMLGAHALYSCAPQYLNRIADSAKAVGAEVHMHISESRFEVEQAYEKYQRSPVAIARDCGLMDCGLLAAHCVHVDESDVEILAANNVRVVHNPGSNMFLGNGIAPIRAMLERDICVALGTDGAACNNNLDIIEELRLATLLQKGNCMSPTALTAPQAIKMATFNGAEALGLKKCGKILPGYTADVIIMSMSAPHWHPRNNISSQFVYAANSTDVETVIIDGEIVVKNRQLLTIDEERLYQEVAKFNTR
jgi:5-methylthioadenosine/S-adenosylhomocysteine deaminase